MRNRDEIFLEKTWRKLADNFLRYAHPSTSWTRLHVVHTHIHSTTHLISLHNLHHKHPPLPHYLQLGRSRMPFSGLIMPNKRSRGTHGGKLHTSSKDVGTPLSSYVRPHCMCKISTILGYQNHHQRETSLDPGNSRMLMVSHTFCEATKVHPGWNVKYGTISARSLQHGIELPKSPKHQHPRYIPLTK